MPTRGYDAESMEYVDMIQAGIIDPAKVERVALQNAASIASLLLTTEALITDIPEEKAGGRSGDAARGHVLGASWESGRSASCWDEGGLPPPSYSLRCWAKSQEFESSGPSPQEGCAGEAGARRGEVEQFDPVDRVLGRIDLGSRDAGARLGSGDRPGPYLFLGVDVAGVADV